MKELCKSSQLTLTYTQEYCHDLITCFYVLAAMKMSFRSFSSVQCDIHCRFIHFKRFCLYIFEKARMNFHYTPFTFLGLHIQLNFLSLLDYMVLSNDNDCLSIYSLQITLQVLLHYCDFSNYEKLISIVPLCEHCYILPLSVPLYKDCFLLLFTVQNIVTCYRSLYLFINIVTYYR